MPLNWIKLVKIKICFDWEKKIFVLDQGELIEAEIIKKTKQETVPNIFIKQQHMGEGDVLHSIEIIFGLSRWM